MCLCCAAAVLQLCGMLFDLEQVWVGICSSLKCVQDGTPTYRYLQYAHKHTQKAPFVRSCHEPQNEYLEVWLLFSRGYDIVESSRCGTGTQQQQQTASYQKMKKSNKKIE